MKPTLFVVCCALLAGCANSISPSQLEPPAKALMIPPKPMPTLSAGDDLVVKHAELRRLYSTETDKQRRLQKYVRTIIKP